MPVRAKLLASTLIASSLALLSVPALAQESVADTSAVEALGAVPKGKLTDAVVPASYAIDLYVDPALDRFSGATRIAAKLSKPSRYIDLHGLDLAMKSATATIKGKSYSGQWTQLDDTGVARLVFDEVLPAGAVTLDFTYDAPFNDGPAGLFHVKMGDNWFAWTQFESIDARRVFPSFDEPGFKVPLNVTLRTRPGQVAVSNTPEVEITKEGGWEVHRFAPSKPLPTYLAAMMVGPFAVKGGTIPATPERPEVLAQRVATNPENAGSMDYALENTAQIIPLLETYFGIGYPFEKLDQITTPILPGAMENAGAVLYQDSIIILDDSSSTSRKRNFGMVVAHELGHQWFGDLVTPAWWDDIWLNESFANWVGYYVADKWKPELKIWAGALEEGFDAMDTDALVVGRPIRQPINTNGQVDSAFDTITYGKGGHVISMIAGYMGEEKFRDGVRLHLRSHAYGNATGDDFFGALAKAAGDPRIVQSMKSFVEQQGVPLVTISGENGKYTLTQSRYANIGATPPETTWLVPVCMRRGDARKCQMLDGKSMTMSMDGNGPPLPNAGGNGYYRFDLPTGEWDALIAQSSSLEGGEAQAVADSLTASFTAGRSSATQLVDLARQLVRSNDGHAYEEAYGLLATLNMPDVLAGPSEDAYRSLANELYAPKLAELGFDPKKGAYTGTDPEISQLRGHVVARMAIDAKDPAVRATLAKAAASYLAGDTNALDPAFMSVAMIVYAQEGDLARVKALADKGLSSQDPSFRPAAIRAIGSTGNTEIARYLLDDWKDERLRPTEQLQLLGNIVTKQESRGFGSEWMTNNLDVLSKQLGGIFFTRSLPYLITNFCSAERADQFEAEFRATFAGTPGELSLARALEQVRTCATLTHQRGDEMRAAVLAAS